MSQLLSKNRKHVKILPLKKEHMQTYAHMEINEAQGHKDPSDHVVIPVSDSIEVKGWTWYSIRNNLHIVYVRIAFVRVVEVKYSKTLSAYLFYSFFCKKIGRCVLCTHLLNLFNVNK